MGDEPGAVDVLRAIIEDDREAASDRAEAVSGVRFAGGARSAPRTTVQTPYEWSADHSWKRDFWNVDLTPEQLAVQKAGFDRDKEIARAKREAERV